MYSKSHTWHQMMRNDSEPPVNFLARKIFHIPPRTYLSNYPKIFGAFFVAYVLHGYGLQIAGGSLFLLNRLVICGLHFAELIL